MRLRSALALLLLAGTVQAARAAPAPDGGVAAPAAPAPEAPSKTGPEAAPRPGAESPAKPGPVVLANHRAVYDLSLASSGGTRAVEGARGRIVIDFRGDACRGYTMQTRQVTVLDSAENGSRTSDLRNTTFEGGDGHEFRFRTASAINGTESPAVDGTASADPAALKVRLKEPKRDQFGEAGPVLFPTRHMRRLIEAARAGETTVQAKVFDGSDDGRKIYDTLAVIGRPITGAAGAAKDASKDAAAGQAKEDAAPERDKPLRDGALADVRRWPVTLSYFTQGEGERTPIYTLSFDLYDNGVSGALKLDYGDFAILGDLTRLDMDKAAGSAPCKP